MYYERLEGNENARSFQHFLDQLAAYRDQAGLQNAILIMDNVRFHHNANVIEMLNIHEFNYYFLPEYSPFFNPIENLFSQWKHFTKQCKPQNEEELINAIDRVATDNTIVTAAHCAAYVRKVSQNCHNCTLGAVDFEN